MSVLVELIITVECDECGDNIVTAFEGNQFGTQVDEHDEIIDAQLRAEFANGWEILQTSFEKVAILCPRCKAERDAPKQELAASSPA